MRTRTQVLLRQLASLHPCIVISGRSRSDLSKRLAGTGILRLIGNHGAEQGEVEPETCRQIELWRDALVQKLFPLAGLRVENSGLSLTVHYRNCLRKATARCEILKAVRLIPGGRVIAGKEAISLVPKNAPNKGSALCEELAHLACKHALYVGDDETDEDVFALRESLHLVTIRVGRTLRSKAEFFLRGQYEINDLLENLISC